MLKLLFQCFESPGLVDGGGGGGGGGVNLIMKCTRRCSGAFEKGCG